MVLNSFPMCFAFTRLVRARLAGLYGFPGAWMHCMREIYQLAYI
ncbi:MAG: hypothetical protein WC091_17410 [Sulfuricellaceae bacterium]